MLTKQRILIIGCVLLLVVGAWKILFALPKAPDTAFMMLNGNTVNTSRMQGSVVVVNFWSTSCGPCVMEMPVLEQIYQRYRGRGLQMLAVAVQRDAPQEVANFAAKRGISFQMAYDATGEVSKAWGGIRYTPTTFVVDRSGHIVKQYIGIINRREFENLLTTLL